MCLIFCVTMVYLYGTLCLTFNIRTYHIWSFLEWKSCLLNIASEKEQQVAIVRERGNNNMKADKAKATIADYTML